MPVGVSPSDEAKAFLADPANRLTWRFCAAELTQMRADARALAEQAAPNLAKSHDVSLDWQEIAGVETLLITPTTWNGSSKALYLFGGSFISGGPLEDLMISAALASGSGMQIASPAYALAPEHPFPQGRCSAMDVARAVQPDAIVGESAGGNLALSVTRTLVAEGQAPEALALLSPAADMSPAFDPYSAPDDPTLYPPLVEEMTAIYAPGADPFDPQLSPLYGTFSTDWPPCLITTGTRDLFLGQCAQLSRAMRDAGASADLRVWDGLWHVFEYYPHIPEAAKSLREISEFLRRHHANANR